MTDLQVRTATAEDAAALLALQADPLYNSKRAFVELIDLTLQHFPFLVAERDGCVVGSAYATVHRSRLALRWSVDAWVQAPGQPCEVAQALYHSLTRHLMEQGFMAIYAAVQVGDCASIALHQRLGFAPIGVHQGIDLQRDAEYWCLTLATPGVREEPVPFNALRQRLPQCGR